MQTIYEVAIICKGKKNIYNVFAKSKEDAIEKALSEKICNSGACKDSDYEGSILSIYPATLEEFLSYKLRKKYGAKNGVKNCITKKMIMEYLKINFNIPLKKTLSKDELADMVMKLDEKLALETFKEYLGIHGVFFTIKFDITFDDLKFLVSNKYLEVLYTNKYGTIETPYYDAGQFYSYTKDNIKALLKNKG